ncbi:nucleoside-diphosphate-sugar epimerase [Streptosporangium album]|uniref:Nucleoside-diphosphate-sugar epimerase n=1 Tax=Streptosporangium album TaxID=47479 RepID=A0A7W7WEN3_9ACTN|nr:NAD(P)-dependent oxidoreductase [Streptosporangium album]MBB4944038.1 nucleoside-diphosphate-sugar epimerase [Streptosporangium album]
MTSSRVAVLGATGCVGRQVCAALTRDGHDVLAIARNHAPHVSSHPFLSMDVAATAEQKIAEVFDAHGVDAIVNATGGWAREEAEMAYAHVHLVERLVEAAGSMARRPRLVHIGTIHEYGPVPAGVLIDESVDPRPVTPYARTKLAGSQAVLAAGDVDGVVLRAVNVCGPHTTEASFLGMVAAKLRDTTAAEGLELSIADAQRDYIDVRDLADAVVKAIGAPARGRVVNIGRGVATGMRELVALLVAAAGLPPDVLRERDGQVESKGGDWTRADITLARELLAWQPGIGLAESIQDMWKSLNR